MTNTTMKKEIVTKNSTQLKYMYGEETVKALETAMENTIRNGNFVTVSINELDKFSYKHMVIAKAKLFIKRIFNK